KVIDDDAKGRRYWFNRFLERVKNGYGRILKWVLKFRKTTVIGTVLAIGGSLALVPFVGTAFIPESDQVQVSRCVDTARGSAVAHTSDVVHQVNDKLDGFDEWIETNFVSVGGEGFIGTGGTGNTASFTMQLIPSTERDKSTKEIVRDI